jgi:hypothetical protein
MRLAIFKSCSQEAAKFVAPNFERSLDTANSTAKTPSPSRQAGAVLKVGVF